MNDKKFIIKSKDLARAIYWITGIKYDTVCVNGYYSYHFPFCDEVVETKKTLSLMREKSREY